MNKFIDLHLHTICSDGTFTASEIINIAFEKGISAVAITDHDSVDGIDEAMICGKKEGVEVIPGVELSAYDDDDIEVHILGYFIDYKDKWFVERLEEIRDVRKKRYEKILSKLKEIEIDLTGEDFPGEDECVSYGRPHVARLLLKKGYVHSFKEAFVKYIGKGCHGYVEKKRLTVPEAIEMVIKVNGIPVLAHPGILNDDNKVNSYIGMGILGIEAYHSDHSLQEQMKYVDIAKKHNILITGGSDCHGKIKKDILMGKVKVPYEVLERMRKAKRMAPS
ncbi:PHP domain-containing protein [Chlamydiota bacterium]